MRGVKCSGGMGCETLLNEERSDFSAEALWSTPLPEATGPLISLPSSGTSGDHLGLRQGRETVLCISSISRH